MVITLNQIWSLKNLNVSKVLLIFMDSSQQTAYLKHMCIQSSRQKKVKCPNYIPTKTIKTRNVKFWQNSFIFHLCLPIIYISSVPKVQIMKYNTKNIFSLWEVEQGCIFFCLTPPPGGGGAKIWPNNMLGKKMIEREWKKGGKCIYFPQLVKSMHIFSPIDLKFTKLQKKGLKIFACGAHPPIVINFLWGKNMIQERGEAKILISNLIYTPENESLLESVPRWPGDHSPRALPFW